LRAELVSLTVEIKFQRQYSGDMRESNLWEPPLTLRNPLN